MGITPLVEFFANVLGSQPGAIRQALIAEDGTLNPDFKTTLLPLFQKKLEDAKRDGKEEGKGWGTKESREQLEGWIKETYNIEPTGDVKSQIQNLISEITKSSKLTEDDVKNSEIFQNEIKKFQEEIKNRDQEIISLKENSRRERITSVLKQKANSVLQENNFVVPEDRDVAENLQKLFIQSLWKEGIDFKVDEAGNITPTNEKGDPLKDNLHNPIGFDDYATGVARLFFPVREGSGGETPGNTTKKIEEGPTYKFENREDAMQKYNAEKDPVKKEAILKTMRTME